MIDKRDAYAALREKISGVMTTELVLRDERALAVDRIRGQVRAQFPGDRALWRVIFPSPVSTSSGSGEVLDEDGGEGETSE